MSSARVGGVMYRGYLVLGVRPAVWQEVELGALLALKHGQLPLPSWNQYNGGVLQGEDRASGTQL